MNGMKAMALYDLVIKGGRVIDPARGLDGVADIAVAGGRIAQVGGSISAAEGREMLDASGMLVTPGLIDFHCHVYDGIDLGIAPDQAGVMQGVTTVVDGGSAGQRHIADFAQRAAGAHTAAYCYLNLSSNGLSVLPEFRSRREVDIDACREAVSAYSGFIKGIKMRLVGELIASHGREVLASAKQLAAESGLPLMVHIGDVEKRVPASLTSVCLDMLTAGDVLLHIYTPQQGGLLGEDGSLVPGLRDAVGRGVLLDAAPGVYNVSYDVGRALMDKGLLPDIISSDVTSWSLKGPVYGLAATMSRYMALGLSLAQVIEMATAAPARALCLSAGKGSLAVGMDADISVLEVKTGEWQIPDSTGKLLKLEKLLMPVLCLKGGEVILSNPAGRP